MGIGPRSRKYEHGPLRGYFANLDRNRRLMIR